MKKNTLFILLVLILMGTGLTGMARRGQYDEEAREAERIEKIQRREEKRSYSPVQGVASGIKDVVSGPAGFVSETARGTASRSPVNGALEGVNDGSQELLDHTVKGAVKVATLGFGDVHHYEVQEPEAGSGEPTKIKIKIPGT